MGKCLRFGGFGTGAFRLPLLLFLVLLNAVAGAEPLSWERAREEALASNPTLARLQARVVEAREKGNEAASGGNPRLELQARYAYVTPQLGFGSFPLVVNNNYSAGLVLEQAIATFGRLHWSKQAAELQVRAAEHELQRERERVILNTLLTYSRLQTTRQAIGVAEQAVTARRRLLEDLHTRVEVGVSARYEVLVAEVALAQDEQRLLQARQQSALALSQLQVLLGWPRSRSIEPETLTSAAAVLPPVDDSLEQALRQRAELQAMDAAVQAAEARVHFEESQDNPTLGLQTRYDVRNSTAFQTSNQWSAGVEFRWPLFDGGLSAARTAEAEAARVQLSESRREIERQVRLEVEEALLRCQTSEQTLEVARRSLVAAEEGGRLTDLRFRVQMGTHQEVLDAQARLREAQQAVLEAEQARREAHWQLQFALGAPL